MEIDYFARDVLLLWEWNKAGKLLTRLVGRLNFDVRMRLFCLDVYYRNIMANNITFLLKNRNIF